MLLRAPSKPPGVEATIKLAIGLRIFLKLGEPPNANRLETRSWIGKILVERI